MPYAGLLIVGMTVEETTDTCNPDGVVFVAAATYFAFFVIFSLP